MKKLLLTTLAVGLFAAASIAVAQDDQQKDKKPDQAAKPGNAQGQAGKAPVQKGAPPAPVRSGQAAVREGASREGPAPQRATAGSQMAPQATNHGNMNVATLERNVQAPNRYHVAAYRPPQGYAPRQWSYGQRLPVSYYASNYWIADYLMYALFAPPPGLVWVRVGDDALLIDQNTGQVIQVQYNVFY